MGMCAKRSLVNIYICACTLDMFFLVEWLEEQTHSVVSSKDLLDQCQLSTLRIGDSTQVKVKGTSYSAKILGLGKFCVLIIMKLYMPNSSCKSLIAPVVLCCHPCDLYESEETAKNC